MPAILITGRRAIAPLSRPSMLQVASTTRYLLIAGPSPRAARSEPDDYAAVYDLQSRIKLRPLSRLPRRRGERLTGFPGSVDSARARTRLRTSSAHSSSSATSCATGSSMPRRAPTDRVVRGDRPRRPRLRPFVSSVAAAAEVARGLAEGEALVEGKTYDLGRHVNGWTINYTALVSRRLSAAGRGRERTRCTSPCPRRRSILSRKPTQTAPADRGEHAYRLVFAPDAPPRSMRSGR